MSDGHWHESWYVKPRFRRVAPTRMLGVGVPDDAQPGDLVVGNRGAAAQVLVDTRLRLLSLEYVGNYHHGIIAPGPGCKLYDFR